MEAVDDLSSLWMIRIFIKPTQEPIPIAGLIFVPIVNIRVNNIFEIEAFLLYDFEEFILMINRLVRPCELIRHL